MTSRSSEYPLLPRTRDQSKAVSGRSVAYALGITCLIAISVVGLVLSAIALSRYNGPSPKTQVISYADQPIDPSATQIVFDRLDWKQYYPNGNLKGTFVHKCGIYDLPYTAAEGTRIVFYNHHAQVNILMHPDPFGLQPAPAGAPQTNAEFWHIVMNGHDQVVEIEWIGWNHGWTVIRNHGGGMHGHAAEIMSIKNHFPSYMYTVCTLRGMPSAGVGGTRDFLATIDINPEHVEYGTIVHIALGSEPSSAVFADTSEYHHGDLLHIDGHMYFAAPSLNFRNGLLDFFSLESEKAPVLSGYLTKTETQAQSVSAFHTTHVNPQTGDILISHLGSDGVTGVGPGGFVKVSPNVGAQRLSGQPNPLQINGYFTLPLPGTATTIGATGDRYNYDFHIDYCNNELVTTSWGPPSSFDAGFDVTLASPYGRAIRIYKMPSEGTSGGTLTHLHTFVTDPTPELGGPPTGEGVVPLEVRRVHAPGIRTYFVGITLPGAIDVLQFNEVTTTWEKTVVISPAKIRSDCESTLVLSNASPAPAVPIYDLLTATVGPANLGKVPLITDITLSQDDQFLYVSCWLAGALLQYDVSDPLNPVFVGGVANLGGVRGTLSTGLLFNTGSWSFASGSKKFAGGPQMLRLDPSGSDLYVTNSLFSSWDTMFYKATVGNPTAGSIEDNGGMLIKLKTGVRKGSKIGPMSIDTSFGDNGVVSFTGLTHPSVTGVFASRAHESHISGVSH